MTKVKRFKRKKGEKGVLKSRVKSCIEVESVVRSAATGKPGWGLNFFVEKGGKGHRRSY